MINSTDYHDFVIKDGKLIGEFEQMYQKSKDIPWHQNEQDDWLDIRLTTEILKEYGKFDTIVDFGCGLGYFLNILKKNVGNKNCSCFGYDVSDTCCEKAKENFPNMSFNTINLMDNNFKSRKFADKTLLSIRGTLWYVFPNMNNVVKNISSMSKRGDYLLISQNFPPLDYNFVGKSEIPNSEAIIKWFNCFKPIRTMYLEDKLKKDNSNWFVGIFIKE